MLPFDLYAHPRPPLSFPTRRSSDLIAQRMHHTPPPTVTPHAFLACVAAAWQRAHGAPPPPAYAPVPMPPPRPVAAPPPVGPFPAPPPPPGPPPAPPPPGPSGPYGPPPPGPPYRA